MTVPNNGIQVKKFIDTELLLFIYHKNFAFWDYYVSHFLVSFREFRKFFSKLFSKSPDLNVDEDLKKVFPNENKVNKLNYDNTSVCYLLTLKEENGLMKNYLHYLNSFSVKARDDNRNLHHLKFNIKQMKILSKIAEERDMNSFFKKLIVKSTMNGEQTLKVDMGFFEKVDDEYLNIISNLSKSDSPSVNGSRIDTR